MSGRGEVGCYFSMTSDEDNPADYVVSVSKNEGALLGTVDGTDPRLSAYELICRALYKLQCRGRHHSFGAVR
ncbi:hypothetical protein ACHGLA_30480 [Streptomyces sp. YH02]|uniref:hypothetical protein n=1 Tax=Streptomyces sp. YH02 TaxID=3256999 RepID=UPI003757AC2C